VRVKSFATALVAALLIVALTSSAPAADKLWRLGVLAVGSAETIAPFMDAFRVALRELGYVEGKTFVLEIRSAEGRTERLPALAAELVRQKVDLIVTAGGNTPTLTAKQATSTIPIVMTSSVDAVDAGIVRSLPRPGGNITGLSVPKDVGYKVVELLRELNPSLSRVTVLVRASFPQSSRIFSQGSALARFRIILNYAEVNAPEDLARALAAVQHARPDAMIVGADGLFLQERERILEFARSTRLPAVYFYPEVVEAGGLMSYSIGRREAWRTAARYVDQIAKGLKPADLPVQQPSKLELTINLKTAKSIGVTVPPSLLLRAERVIE
jgi:putative ABC transport system substrate-binding protein